MDEDKSRNEKTAEEQSWKDRPAVRIMAIVLAAAMLLGLMGQAIWLLVQEKREKKESGETSILERYNEYYNLAAEAIENEDYEAAIDNIGLCLQLAETGSKAELELRTTAASVYILSGQSAKALPELRRAIQMSPDSSELLLLKAQAELDTGLYDSAEADMEAYLNMVPGDKEMLQVMAELCESREKYEKAAKYYKNLSILKDNEPADVINTARCHILADNYDGALSELQIILKEAEDGKPTEDIETVFFLSGICRMQAGDYQGSADDFTRAMEHGYDKSVCLLQLAACAFVDGEYQKVLDLGAEFESLGNAADAGLYQQMGVSALALENADSAVAYLSRSIESDPEYPGSSYYRGLCYITQEKWEEAIADMSSAIEQEYLVEDSLYRRGLCYVQIQDYDKARNDMERVMQNASDESLSKSAEEVLDLIDEETDN